MMARKKGNQLKKGVHDSGSALPNQNERANASESNIVYEEEAVNKGHSNVTVKENINVKPHVEAETKSKYRSGKPPRREKQALDTAKADEIPVTDAGDTNRNSSTEYASQSVEGNMSCNNYSHSIPKSCSADSLNAASSRDNTEGNVDSPDTTKLLSLRNLALSIMNASSNWLERHRPLIVTAGETLSNACRYVQMKAEHAYPLVLEWIAYFASILVLLGMMWLDCTLRGIDSLLRMGTTSFFSVLWCGILSVIAMVGMFKFLLVLVSLGFCLSMLLVLYIHLLAVFGA